MNAIEFLHCSSRFAPVRRLQTARTDTESVYEALYLSPSTYHKHTNNTRAQQNTQQKQQLPPNFLMFGMHRGSKPGKSGRGAYVWRGRLVMCSRTSIAWFSMCWKGIHFGRSGSWFVYYITVQFNGRLLCVNAKSPRSERERPLNVHV